MFTIRLCDRWQALHCPDGTKRMDRLISMKSFATKREMVEKRKDFAHRVYPAVKGSTSIWAFYQRALHPRRYQYAAQEEKRAKMANTNAELRKKNSALVAANAELANLAKRKDDFIAVVFHDLRNPFNGIVGLAEVMKENASGLSIGRELTRDQLVDFQTCAKYTATSANSAYNLLNRFTEIYQIYSGMDFTPKSFSLSDRVAAQIGLYSANANEKRIDISSSIPEGVFVFANPEMTGEVIGNLISNAIKFTHQGGKVNISYRALDGNQIEVSVSDNGIGMSQETQEELLVKQNGRTTNGTDNESGTGFGIRKVMEIVERMGGRFELESEVGKGTSCRFTLTAAQDQVGMP